MTDNHDVDCQITSIADAVIKLKEIRESNKNLNEPDIEERFARLSLAFRTDKFTLTKRLELQQRQRDIAEKNIETELKSLRESLNALNQLCTDSDMREVITKTQQHVDIVQQTTMRMSSRAETYGAIQQEQRLNCAFETMLSYVEHLKLMYDKEHLELEEYRRLLSEHNLLPGEKSLLGDGGDDSKRSLLPPRSHSLSSSSKPEGRARLLSAVCLLNSNPDSSPLTINANLTTSINNNNLTLSPKSRRASMPVGPLNNNTSSSQTPMNLKLIPTDIPEKQTDNQDIPQKFMDAEKDVAETAPLVTSGLKPEGDCDLHRRTSGFRGSISRSTNKDNNGN